MTAHPIPIRLLCAALVVGLLGGCEIQQHTRFTDTNGCDWEIDYIIHQFGGDVVRFTNVKPRLSSEGKPMCGKP